MQVRLFDEDFESVQTTNESPTGDFIVEIQDDGVWSTTTFEVEGEDVRIHAFAVQVKVVESVKGDNADGRVFYARISRAEHLKDHPTRGFVYKNGLADLKLYAEAVAGEDCGWDPVMPTANEEELDGIVERGHIGIQVPLRVTKRSFIQKSRGTGEDETRSQFRFQFKTFG